MVFDDEVEVVPHVAPPVLPLERQLTGALAGAVFPLRREALVAVALENEAPRMLVSLLGGLPEGRFEDPTAVARALELRPLPS